MARYPVLSGVLWLTSQQVARQIISFCIFVVLGRLLDPADFGVVALGTSFIMVLQTFSSQGIAQAVVQRPNLSASEAESAYAFNVFASLAIFVCAFAIILVAAQFNGMTSLLLVLASLIFALPLSSMYEVHQARLVREFEFGIIARKVVIAQLAGGIVAVAFAFAGAGVWSLVIQQYIVIFAELYIVRRASKWRPRLVVNREFVGHLARFGGYLFGARLLTVLDMRSPDIIIGAVVGPSGLGYFRIARNMFDVVLSVFGLPIRGVALPLFSRKQEEPGEARRAFLSLCEASCWLLLPPFLTLAIWAPIFIEFLFGQKWESSGWILQVLSLQVFIYAMFHLYEPLLVGLGLTRRLFELRIWQTAIGLFFLVVAAPFGFVALVVAQTAAVFFSGPIMFLFLRRSIDLDFRSFISAIWRPMASGAGFVLIAAIIYRVLVDVPLVLGLLVAIGLAFGCYLGCFYLFSSRELSSKVIESIRGALVRKRAS